MYIEFVWYSYLKYTREEKENSRHGDLLCDPIFSHFSLSPFFHQTSPNLTSSSCLQREATKELNKSVHINGLCIALGEPLSLERSISPFASYINRLKKRRRLNGAECTPQATSWSHKKRFTDFPGEQEASHVNSMPLRSVLTHPGNTQQSPFTHMALKEQQRGGPREDIHPGVYFQSTPQHFSF